MYYYNPRVKNKYSEYFDLVEGKHVLGARKRAILETYSGLIRVLAYANTTILRTEVTDDNILVSVKLHNGTSHEFNLEDLAIRPTSAAAYTQRELIFDQLKSNFKDKKFFKNTSNALQGVENFYQELNKIRFEKGPAEYLSYLRSLTGEKVFEFAKTQFPNLDNTSSIGFSQAVLLANFFEVNGGVFASDMERLANSLEILFAFDKQFQDYTKPGQYARSKSNAIYNFQTQIDENLSELNGVVLGKQSSKNGIIKPFELNEDSELKDFALVTEIYAYDTVMATKLMDEPLNTPMDTQD